MPQKLLRNLGLALLDNGAEYSRIREAFDAIASYVVADFTGKELLALLNRAYKQGGN